jgi:hypothetical protein
MNRRAFLRSMLATVAMTTGLARVRLEEPFELNKIPGDDTLTVEKVRRAVAILQASEVPADEQMYFVIPRWAAEHAGIYGRGRGDVYAERWVHEALNREFDQYLGGGGD